MGHPCRLWNLLVGKNCVRRGRLIPWIWELGKKKWINQPRISAYESMDSNQSLYPISIEGLEAGIKESAYHDLCPSGGDILDESSKEVSFRFCRKPPGCGESILARRALCWTTERGLSVVTAAGLWQQTPCRNLYSSNMKETFWSKMVLLIVLQLFQKEIELLQTIFWSSA